MHLPDALESDHKPVERVYFRHKGVPVPRVGSPAAIRSVARLRMKPVC